MRYIFLLLTFFFVTSCTTTKYAYEHYEVCESYNLSFNEIVACGKRNRNVECSKNNSCTSMGNRLVKILDTLAKQVKSGEISESTAKLRYYDYIASYEREVKAQEAAAWQSVSDAFDDIGDSYKSTTCFNSGNISSYGSYFGTTTCY